MEWAQDDDVGGGIQYDNCGIRMAMARITQDGIGLEMCLKS